ncbi:MAG: patatin-like phospholipase family protein [Acidobacteriota bacterium]
MRTGLVLSAGGLYCAYQAGAWKAVAQYAPPDLVAGASAGALNGWLIAGGCSPEQLIERWLDPSSSDLLRVVPRPGWRRGYFDREVLRLRTERLVAEFQPRIPLGISLVEVPRFRTVMRLHPHITARHLEATCAIPLFMPSVRIDGIRYIDGGVIEKMPVRGAIEMGATRIIAIDALPLSNLWWLRLGGALARGIGRKGRAPRDVEILTISPSEPLGDTNSAVFWKRENIERRIDLGYRDALRSLAAGPAPGISDLRGAGISEPVK